MSTEQQLQAELAKLRAENERLKAAAKSKLKLAVSKSGGVMVLGMRRFPITFFKKEWIILLSMADDIKAFIKANEAKLSSEKSEEAIG